MREVCFVIARGGAIVHADASTSPVALPDSRQRWQAIWHHRDELEVIAHSHPQGPSAFSAEDDTTMAALDDALGRAVRYAVVAPRALVVRNGARGADERVLAEPWWAELLRLASGMNVHSADRRKDE